MRLVDLDKLMRSLGITDMHCCDCKLYDMASRVCKRGKSFVDVCRAIEDAPIIKIHERKWLKEDRGGVEYTAVCSECGYSTFWSDIQYYNYCPRCGERLISQESNEYELDYIQEHDKIPVTIEVERIND